MTIRDIGILFGYEVDEASEGRVENSVQSLKSMAAKALGAIGLTLSISGIAGAVKDCVSLASQVEEMENKFDVVFGDLRDEVDQWAQSYSDAIGRNKNDIKTYVADQQNLLVGFGMTREAGAELSKQMTTLALDLASFANLDESSAVDNMTKAVMGESEAAKALGAVLNENTRAQAMQTLGLSGTYEKLDQLTKMQVNYQAILSQSPDAIGDCERSLGSYESTMRRFQSKLKEVKQLIGQFFMPTFQKVLSFGTRGLTSLRNVIQKIFDFAEKVGGAEKILKVLAAALAATFVAMNVKSILTAAEGFGKLAKALGTTGLKALSTFAVFLILFLIIQDFIAFLRGDNSVIGELFDRAGIGAENARKIIINAWQTIKTFLFHAWQTIKNVAAAIFDRLSAWWAQNGETVKGIFSAVWEGIKTICEALWNGLSTAAQTIFGALTAWWAENGEAVLETFAVIWESIQNLCETVWNGLLFLAQVIFEMLKTFWEQWGETILAVFSAIWNTLVSLIAPFLDALAGVIDFLANVFTGNWQGAWNAVGNIVSSVWAMIVSVISGAWDAICAVWNGLASWFGSIFEAAKSAVVEKVNGIREAIVTGFQAAIAYITSLPSQAFKWGADIINNIVNGIKSGIGAVAGAVGEVANKIKSFLHFSEPDEGPLSNFHTYMPDMMDLMAQGIAAGKEKVKGALEFVTGDMAVIAKSDMVSAGTAKTMSHSAVSNRSIVQHIEISNQFNGDRAGQQKSAAAMDKAADDTTGQLARALAFAG